MVDNEKNSNTIGFKSRGSTASWKLRATQPDGTASELFIADGLTIGRTSANAIQAIGDGSGVVERSHARVDSQDDGSFFLKCLHEGAGVESAGSTVSSLRLEMGSTFRIGQTQFEVIASPTSEQFTIASAGRGCPYCGHPDLPADRGVATQCSACGQPIVVVPPDQNLGLPTFLPGIFRDAEGKEYAAERFVARGGMGYVLKGKAEQGTAIAIKVLIFDSNTNPQAVLRFKQEIDLLRKLHDPNVLRLISHGQEAGLFFFAMEWVDGQDLRSKLPIPGKSGTYVEFSTALKWFEQACEGLSAIHRNGAVHRDIKPSNLLLRSDGQLLIADLGVAKRLNDGETSMTCTGQLPGTFWYMAPEQHCAPDLVDQRTDIYSLGFTFWELLTGVKPNVVGLSPPSAVNSTVPPWFDNTLLAMLAAIQDRPANMLEVLRSLPSPTSRLTTSLGTDPVTGTQPAHTTPTGLHVAVAPPSEQSFVSHEAVNDPAAGTATKPADYIDYLATILRWADARARAGLAHARPHVIQLLATICTRAADLRQAWKVASTPTPTPSHHSDIARHSAVADKTHTPVAVTATELNGRASPRVAVSASTGNTPVGAKPHATSAADIVAEQDAIALEDAVAKASKVMSGQLQAALGLQDGSDEQLDALKSVRRALTLLPADIHTPTLENEFRPAIERDLSMALRRKADEAFADKRHGTALVSYEELRRLSHADDLVTDRIDQILTLRKAAFGKAVATMRGGQLSRAREQLRQLQRDFIGDAGFVSECEPLIEKTRLFEQRVKETIPALQATKSLFRMSRMLDQLASEHIVISGLPELLNKTRNTLLEGSRKLDVARAFLGEGRVESARKALAEVRNVISDHPDADDLSGKVDAEEARQSRLAQDVLGLAQKGNLLRVHRSLKKEPPPRLAKLGLVDLLKQAEIHKQRTDRFVRLLAWVAGGTAAIGMASYASHYAWAGIVSVMPANSQIRGFLEDTASGKCLLYVLFALTAYLGLHGLRELLAGAHKTRLLKPDVFALLAIMGLFFVADIGQKALITRMPAGTALASQAGYWLLNACAVAAYAATIATFCRIGIDVVAPRVAVPLRPAILFAIALTSVAVITQQYCSNEDRSRLFGIVPTTVVAMAVAATLVSVNRIGIYAWPMAAGIVGFLLSRWMGFHDFTTFSWTTLLWWATLACGLFLGLQQRAFTTAFFAVTTAFIALAATSYAIDHSGFPNTLNRLLPWAAACVVVPTIAQSSITRRLDAQERLTDALLWLQSPTEIELPADENSDADAAKELSEAPRHTNSVHTAALSTTTNALRTHGVVSRTTTAQAAGPVPPPPPPPPLRPSGTSNPTTPQPPSPPAGKPARMSAPPPPPPPSRKN
jgi:serine/threonine protein kinase